MADKWTPESVDRWRLRIFAELEADPTSSALLRLMRGELEDLDPPRHDLLELFNGAVVDLWLAGFASARIETIRGAQDQTEPFKRGRLARLATWLRALRGAKP